MLSAINGDSKALYPGYAIFIKNDRAFAAGPSPLLPVGIVTVGASQKGVILYTDSGIVELRDWTLSTGKAQLDTGKAYFASPGGKISPTGTGLSVGIAASSTQLSVQIASPTSPNYEVISAGNPPEPVVQPAVTLKTTPDIVIHDGTGSPTSLITMTNGEYWFDQETQQLWGPKAINGWGSPARSIIGKITVSGLTADPLFIGTIAFVADGRKPGEGAGLGTGVWAGYDGTNWVSLFDALPVQA